MSTPIGTPAQSKKEIMRLYRKYDPDLKQHLITISDGDFNSPVITINSRDSIKHVLNNAIEGFKSSIDIYKTKKADSYSEPDFQIFQ